MQAGKGDDKKRDAARPLQLTMKRGYEVLRDPHLNKGMAFTLEERQQLNIHGLLPPCFLGQDAQVYTILKNFERLTCDLDRYMLLMSLQDRNEKLFYKVLASDIEKFMPIVYTPTVGLACQQYGLAFRRPRGLFISIHDRGHIATMLKSWPESVIKAIVVTDGERILGLGDLGCYGMGIPVGKLALYTACGGVKPHECLPVMLDVGTDNEELLKDPLYIGLRHKRIRGQAYDDLLDEFMEAVTARYGMNCLIQFEDFANANAFRLLHKYRNKYCTFNDDIQGTASVAVAGLLAALRITKNKLSDHTVLFQGAGEAALGIANLILMAMEKEGLSKDAAIKRIWLVDSKGLVVKGRASLTHEKQRFAHEHREMKNLEDIVRDIKPSVLIGVAAIGGAFTTQILQDMAALNKRPIIFALSNPTSKAECTAEQCYKYTEGRGIFASGSPFGPVTLPSGKTLYPGQGNNSYVFPGVALGVISCGMRHIEESVFLTTAEVIAQQVTEENLQEGRLYPPLVTIQDVSLKIAVRIAEEAYRNNTASTYPQPKDLEAFIRSQVYSTDYNSFVADSYTWPEEAMKVKL
ncbi:PREDICTED: NADP-dependent malic enzyme isoform X1 [Sturnus vulgaris]|uniref:NADP-dependent malic enzyme isoform X1 n=1 Tax=Sturnus vulgaris TaxID=9172 RepID=UPI00071A784B|nr:PREDICTED: NADP-dependent malic enzyme isoform X1 [Sturnus vulgaris]